MGCACAVVVTNYSGTVVCKYSMVHGSHQVQLKICWGDSCTQNPCHCLDSDPPCCSRGLIPHMNTAVLKRFQVVCCFLKKQTTTTSSVSMSMSATCLSLASVSWMISHCICSVSCLLTKMRSADAAHVYLVLTNN